MLVEFFPSHFMKIIHRNCAVSAYLRHHIGSMASTSLGKLISIASLSIAHLFVDQPEDVLPLQVLIFAFVWQKHFLGTNTYQLCSKTARPHIDNKTVQSILQIIHNILYYIEYSYSIFTCSTSRQTCRHSNRCYSDILNRWDARINYLTS